MVKMASTSPATQVTPRSYRELVREVAGLFPDSPPFKALDLYLNEQPSSIAMETMVSVVDCIDGTHTMHDPAYNTETLCQILPAQGKAISTRLMIVEYTSIPHPDILDLLGSCYDLNPWILAAHVDLDKYKNAHATSAYPGVDFTDLISYYSRGGGIWQFGGMVVPVLEHPLVDDLCPSTG